MSASFKLTLDTTTHVAAAINGGNPTTEAETVTLEADTDADVLLMKVWGDINVTEPGLAGAAETEEAAEWIAYDPSVLVNLSPNPGPKVLHVRVQDDVLNEAVDSALIRLGEEVAPPVPPRTPGWPGSRRRPRSKRERPGQPQQRRVEYASAISLTATTTERAVLAGVTGIVVGTTTPTRSSAQRLTSALNVATTVGSSVGVGHRSRIDLARADSIDRTDIGPDSLAALQALGIL